MSRRTKGSFKQLADYMLKGQKNNTKARDLIIRHNVKGTIEQCVRAFETNEEKRLVKRHDSITAYHELVALKASHMQITEKMLEDLAQKYFELRAPTSMGIAIPHLNTANPHIHFMISGVELETGRASRVSREAFAAIKLELQAYEKAKYPVLEQSSVRHGKKQREIGMVRETEYQMTKRTKATSERERIAAIVKSCHAQALSKDDFMRQMASAGLNTYSRNGVIAGIQEEGRKYRFTTLGYEPNFKDLEVRDAAAKDIAAFREQIETKERDRDIDDRLAIFETEVQEPKNTDPNERDENDIEREEDQDIEFEP